MVCDPAEIALLAVSVRVRSRSSRLRSTTTHARARALTPRCAPKGRDEIAISASDHFISVWSRADDGGGGLASPKPKNSAVGDGGDHGGAGRQGAAAAVRLNWERHRWTRAFACPATQTTLCWCPPSIQHGPTLLSAGVDFVLTLWDVETGEPFRRLREHRDFVTAIIYIEHSSSFASASLDRTVQIWSLQQMRKVVPPRRANEHHKRSTTNEEEQQHGSVKHSEATECASLANDRTSKQHHCRRVGAAQSANDDAPSRLRRRPPSRASACASAC